MAKRTFKNQITIPKEDEIVLKPVAIQGQRARLSRIRQKIKSLGLKENHIDKAIRWARKQ